ncbi:MAG: MerR family transcriptional regulator [Ruminococcaceae bacterium]|nr:MerR family transcriptional regulator [Oscillospiraceae bacterium]
MKIKEVIEKTKLTDRAIRFYIDNGLVSPGIEENYSGRKNIEFSENDIERLSQIALLRKAGFSISDIKEIISDIGNIKEVISRFVETTSEEIKAKSEVIEKLKSFSADEEITVETLCRKLSETAEKNDLPQEDTTVTKKQKFMKIFFRIFSVTGIVSTLGWLLFAVINDFQTFSYMKITTKYITWFLIMQSGILIILGLSIFLLCVCRVPFLSKARETCCSWITVIILPILLPAFVLSVFGVAFSVAESETTSPENYMEFDSLVESELEFEQYWTKYYQTGKEAEEDLTIQTVTTLDLFPVGIPPSAYDEETYELKETTKYYYNYELLSSPNYDIFAEWVLNDYEYEEAKEDAYKFTGYETINKGDWVCLYFGAYDENMDEWEEEQNLEYLIFAYNDNQNKVRYISTKRYFLSKENPPFQTTLDW